MSLLTTYTTTGEVRRASGLDDQPRQDLSAHRSHVRSTRNPSLSAAQPRFARLLCLSSQRRSAGTTRSR